MPLRKPRFLAVRDPLQSDTSSPTFAGSRVSQQPQHRQETSTIQFSLGGDGSSRDNDEPSVSSLSSSFLNRWHTTASSDLPDGGMEVTTLLGGLTVSDDQGDTAGIPTRPRRLWRVSDTKVPTYPALWPKPALFASVYNTSPAVVAIRIAECLSKRSIAAEYDDESATVMCLTVDRCHFSTHLWYRKDNKATIIVEVVRISGNAISFHQAAYAILDAAQSLGSGVDNRTPRQCSSTDFPRLHESLVRNSTKAITVNSSSSSSNQRISKNVAAVTVEAFEQAYNLLSKDRLDAQLIGLESVAHIVDPHCTGIDVAQHGAWVILGAPLPDSTIDSTLLRHIHSDWILPLLLGRIPGEERSIPNTTVPCPSTTPSEMGQPPSNNDLPQGTGSTSLQENDDEIAIRMRTLALFAFANALSILADHQPVTLELILSTQAPSNVSRPVLEALFADLRGASRPLSALGRMASQHEAAISARILGLLASHNISAKETIVKNGALLEEFEKIASIGRSTHAVLAAEARLTYQSLTEEDRSC